MKKKIVEIIFIAFTFIFAFSTNASATFLGYVDGNQDNDPSFVSEVIENYFGNDISSDFDLTGLAKIDVNVGATTSDDVTISYYAPEGEDWGDFILNGLGSSGTWESTWAGVDYISVKAGTGIAVYSVDHLGTGGWTTEKLTNKKGVPKDLSHISFWSAKSTPTPHGDGAQVPEPATIFLLGSGLLGFLGYRKKFWKSKK